MVNAFQLILFLLLFIYLFQLIFKKQILSQTA